MPNRLTASCCCALTTTGTRRAFADAAGELASSAVLPTKDPFALKVCIDRAIEAIWPSNANYNKVHRADQSCCATSSSGDLGIPIKSEYPTGTLMKSFKAQEEEWTAIGMPYVLSYILKCSTTGKRFALLAREVACKTPRSGNLNSIYRGSSAKKLAVHAAAARDRS